ncbi:MAG TPA: rhodanese-like domain-containing protein [Deltaproteobacteria bacterium]|nr:rhodanese-like domain-containing protein [Deltaproteobacteria bacterium]
MSIEQINPKQAKDILDQDPEAIYVDVRSIPEFLAGHPTGAVNIPIMHKNTTGMESNPDFLKVASSVLPKSKKLVVGCMVGGRSQKACEMLAMQGYSLLYNVYGGFGGGRNPETGEAQPGWKDLGLPTSTENGEGVSYESLKKSCS